jgi:hypothetical protein
LKRFHLNRIIDVSGTSGTGKVAEGVIFENGKCALSWLTKYSSIAIYNSIDELDKIHSHDGKTVIEYEKV